MASLQQRLERLSDKQRTALNLLMRQDVNVAPPGPPNALHDPVRQTDALYELSLAQQQLWFLDQLQPDLPTYNIVLEARFRGPLDVAALEQAMNQVAERQQSLRTKFLMRAGKPVAQVVAPQHVVLPVVDLTREPHERRDELAQRQVHDEARRPFNLAAGPLWRTLLLRLSSDEHWLVLSMHHIISDGWSLQVFVREWERFYRAIVEPESGRSTLRNIPIQYADFARWQNQQLNCGAWDEQLAYWRHQLTGAQAELELPFDHPRPPVQSFRGARLPFHLPAPLIESLRSLARASGCTLYMVLLAAFQALLHRYTGQDDLCVGTPVANRNRSDTKGLIGFHVNTVVIRSKLSGDPTFREYLTAVAQTALQAFAHQDLPLEKLVEALQPSRDLSRSPLFQAFFVLIPTVGRDLQLPGITVEKTSEVDTGSAKFDLSVYLSEGAGGFDGYFEYATDLFERSTVERMIGHWQTLLTGIVAEPDGPLSKLPLLGEQERRELLVDFNATATELPCDCTLVDLIERQVLLTPEAPAVLCDDQQLTYEQLNREANRLAHRLQQLGAGPSMRVALCLERTLDALIALWGVLKTGAAYVPLDPAYPRERLAFMLQDSQPVVLLAQSTLLPRLPDERPTTLCLDHSCSELQQQIGDNLEHRPRPSDVAYVMYTSGSTGKPKGVVIEHRGIVNLVRWAGRLFADDLGGVLASTSLCFDLSVFEIFTPLCAGGRVILAENALALADLPGRGEVKLLNTVPSAMAQLLRMGALPCSVRTVGLGGEAPTRAIVNQIYQQPHVQRVFDLYGPTETTVYSTASFIDRDGTAPPRIGRPINNTKVYVLDRHLQSVPVGVKGELYIGGVGVARGYFNRPELTLEQFVPDPFLQPPGSFEQSLARLYRTGDLVRWLPSGELEYFGRLDHQVKIRGFRIELGEIESALRRLPGVRDAVVTAHQQAVGDTRLAAYVTSANGSPPTAAEMRKHLQQSLPDYMVPGAFVLLDALPQTPNGKVDRGALPAPTPTNSTSADTAQTPTEDLVLGVVEELLGHRPGASANFFEHGGHSLLAAQAVARLREILDVNLPLRVLFEAPTVKELAVRIDHLKRTGCRRDEPPLVPRSTDADVPLSFAQQRMWFLAQLRIDTALYHLPAAVRLRGPLQFETFRACIDQLVRRHEALRTVFPGDLGRPVQRILTDLAIPISLDDLSLLRADQRDARAAEIAADEARRAFDLQRGPLVRIRLLRLGEQDHVALFTMHHIVADGWSVGVWLRELTMLYTASIAGQPNPLEPLPIQYADYALWQRQILDGDAFDEQLAYWKQKLHNPPALELPCCRPRPPVQMYRGARHPFRLSAELKQQLQRISRQQGCTVYMILLATYQTLLHRYTGQHDICVGTPVANRGRTETEGLIGCLVNTLVMRGDLSGDPTFRDLLARVRRTTLDAYTHQDVPFERLVEELQPERYLSRSPLFQTLLAIQPDLQQFQQLGHLSLEINEIDTGAAKFDLSLCVSDSADGLAGYFEYNTDLLDTETVQRLADHWQRLLAAAVERPDLRLSELPLLSEAEQRQLLVEFNDTRGQFDLPSTLPELLEQRAQESPDLPAVRLEDQQLTYAELNQRANQLAHYLQELGAGPESRVALCLERSLDMVVALWGVLKAGAAYVPLDPEYPEQRLAYMLEDSQPAVLLTHSSLLARLPEERPITVCLDQAGELLQRQPSDNPQRELRPEHLAYLIYTSGSTGQPKGAMNEHRAVLNRLGWMQAEYQLTAQDRVLQKTPFSFDVSVWEFFWPAVAGAELVLAQPGGHRDSGYLVRLIRQRQISVVHFVPSMLQAFLQEPQVESCQSLRLVFASGEALSFDLVQRCLRCLPQARLHNLYGPTEAAVDVSLWDCRSQPERQPVPIGRPAANTQLYVLDPHLRPTPLGIPGELYIGGVQVGRGYFNRPELTAEKFVPDPFSDQPAARLYKTGDLARWRADGVLEYLGRLDQQVKLRGFRIELGEIEAALIEHPSVQEAAVLLREDVPGDPRLVAYVVPAAGAAYDEGELTTHLKQRLPAHMVPSAWVVLPAMPLSPSGKLDRRALPPPVRQESPRQYIAPRTPHEKLVAQVWSEVLGVERVSIDDNFFHLGGHSLLATQVLSRLRQVYPVNLPLRSLFEEPTVENLARLIVTAQNGRTLGRTDRAGDLIASASNVNAEELAVNLDQLSDDDVEVLLQQALAERVDVTSSARR
jgi:amino acid adenylation domain-containing protein